MTGDSMSSYDEKIAMNEQPGASKTPRTDALEAAIPKDARGEWVQVALTGCRQMEEELAAAKLSISDVTCERDDFKAALQVAFAEDEDAIAADRAVQHALGRAEGADELASRVQEYVRGYEFRFDCGGSYTPNDSDRAMLEDAILGLISTRDGAVTNPSGPGPRGLPESPETPSPLRYGPIVVCGPDVVGQRVGGGWSWMRRTDIGWQPTEIPTPTSAEGPL